ncbi:MAG: carbohydrate ABC transporter substrate-binding protein [Anaerolineaceae bacterium]|nr:carbohydrate ABC transporter substrate-binding protein [Anaerolineaceae bacterium]
MFSRKASWNALALLIVFAMLLSACGGNAAPAAEPGQAETSGEAATDGKQEVEVFSWWTGGGEAAGLDAMIKVFGEQYPDIKFVNAAVAGGAGTNARAVLATRLQAGDAPDSWQGHAGQELIGTYVAANQLEPLNFLYEQNGWLDVMPETLIPLISDKGNIYSVPVNIHRSNVLWYNPQVLADNGLEVPESMDDFIAALETLKNAGVDVPLAMGEQWTAMHLFETILLGSLGPDEYNGLWNGEKSWGDADVAAAIENFKTVVGYTNSDAASLSWQDAAQLVVEGDAAFNIMGDWAEGYFKELEKEPMVDFGWAPVPGSGGTFQFLSDSFVLPTGAPHRDAAIAWLTIAGSKEGQDAFNPVKGSIPARSDGDKSLYDVYLQSAMDDWASDIVVGSLTHGVVANDSWKDTINTSLGLFLLDMDVDAFQTGLVDANASSGMAEAPMAEEPMMSDLTGEVEVFSWWTGGGEAAGLDAMIKIFGAQYPNVEFINAAVAGGAGTNARAVLATRLQAGDAPDSWQGHAGQELIGTYVAANQLEPLNFLYEENGWLDVMPETLIPLISDSGNIYSVPVNIHRANVLWYNPQVLADNGLEVPETMDDFIAALETLQAAGVDVPLAMGEQWTAMHLFETILLGSMGPDAYNQLWTGEKSWGDADVAAAIENFKTVLSYTNSDAASLSWQDAAQLVVEGDAAFNIMGDWAEGYFKELGKEPMVEFGWAPVPGSGGTFQFLSDSFVLPAGAPHRDAAIAWLTIAGSKEGQDAFNPVKGSIPARSDGDKALYDVYLQSAMDDWASDIVVGSLTHGVVANDSWKDTINTSLGLFLVDMDVQGFMDGLSAACIASGPCN